MDLAGPIVEAAGDAKLLSADKRSAVFAELAAMKFRHRRETANATWDMAWQPILTWIDDERNEHHDPDVALIDEKIIEYWLARMRTTKHPALRARYADLAWEIACYRKNHLGVDANPEIDAARTAIQAYLETLEHGYVQDESRFARMLGRAVELSASINDASTLNRAKLLLLDSIEKAEPQARAWSVLKLESIAWAQRGAFKFSSDEVSRIVSMLGRVVHICADYASPENFDPHTAIETADRLRRWLGPEGNKDARRYSLIATHSLELAAEKASALTATIWLEDVVARYRQENDQDSAARVEQAHRKRAHEAIAEMKVASAEIAVPRQELDAWADQIAGDSLHNGLSRLAAECLIGKESSVKSVLKIAKDAPLQAFVPIKPIRSDGFAGTAIGSIEEDLEGRTFHHAANLFTFNSFFLNHAFDRIRTKYSLDADKLMAWFAESPLFLKSHQSLLREGLEAWLQRDSIKAIHVLIPQVECALRELLILLGGTITSPDRAGRGTNFRGVGEILSHERIEFHVPPDVRFHLQVLLSDKRGLNLRNEVAHGLAAPELFDTSLSNWILHATVLLGCIRISAPIKP